MWVSVDPRQGHLEAYPSAVAAQIEAAARADDGGVVDLAPAFFNAQIHLVGPDGTPIQRTARGRRDVRRLTVPSSGEVTLDVVQGYRGAWRAADSAVAGSEERTLLVMEGRDVVIPAAADADTILAMAAAAAVASAGEPASSAFTNNPSDDDDGRPLWEWCRRLGVHPAGSRSLPEDAWGVYSEDQNVTIERAFQANEPHAVITVGIREYKVEFGPEPGFARQKDDALRKMRLVRRRLLPSADWARRLHPPAREEGFAHDQASCPICFADYSDTPAMPVLELPGCRHCFHWACAQQIADQRGPCPCCRAQVDWNAVTRRR